MTFFRSVRFRLVVWYGSVLALSISALGAGMYFTVQTTLTRQIQADLNRDFLAVEATLRDDPGELEELEDYGVVLLFRVTRGGEMVHQTSAWRNAELEGALATLREGSSWSWESPGEDHHFLLRAGDSGEADSTWHFVVARDMEILTEGLHALAVTLLVGLPLVLLLAVMGGYFLAGRVLAPVGAMAAKAREISADRLSQRLPMDNPDDEFGQLALVFNDVLARLEKSFEQLRRFTADASHELRTPLTAIRTVGEVGLRKGGDLAQLREVIGSMLEETDRLTGLVQALLTLTRSEGGPDSLSPSEVDLLALAQECADLLQALAEEKEQTISVGGEAFTTPRVDRRVLRQALVNLLDNAIKYSPVGGSISLTVGRSAESEPMVEVEDRGPGIAPGDQERVFERFFRIEAVRYGKVPGAGLGLSIVRWAAEAHGGRVELESKVGRGSVFRIVLPNAPPTGPGDAATPRPQPAGHPDS